MVTYPYAHIHMTCIVSPLAGLGGGYRGVLACHYNQPKRPGDLDLLTLKVVSESRVTWATSVPILASVSSYARCTRQTVVRQKHRLMPPPIRGGA